MANVLSGKKGEFYGFQADMSKEEDIIKAFEWIKENVGLVHVLVNNAGISRPVPLLDFKSEDANAILDVNVLSLTIATREAIKILKDNNISGHIININSITGHTVYDTPKLAMYTASKYAVTGLTEAMFLEVKRMNLDVKITVS